MSQWEYLLKNLGEWQGSFTRLSPQGEIREDIPSTVILEGVHEHKTIRQTIRLIEQSEPQEKVLEYSALGRNVLFFENGAFSQGSMQLAPFTEFGAELGLIYHSHRLRLVQLYDKQGNLDKFTLIREHLPQALPSQRSPLTLTALLGTWQGEAITIYPDWRSPDSYRTTTVWQQEQERVTMTLQVGDTPTSVLTSYAILTDHTLRFEHSDQQIQTLFLPDGASATCPLQVKVGQPLRLAVSWLLEPNVHQRMLRSYDAKGGWSSLTLVTERKIA